MPGFNAIKENSFPSCFPGIFTDYFPYLEKERPLGQSIHNTCTTEKFGIRKDWFSNLRANLSLVIARNSTKDSNFRVDHSALTVGLRAGNDLLIS